MKVRIVANNPDRQQKVPCIKALRCITGFGLKEAKDAYEDAEAGEVVEADMLPAYAAILASGGREDSLDVLRANNFSFGGIATQRTAVLAALRDSAKVALMSKDYDLAISVINVLKEHDFG